eukprot:362188-Chlamydomonas_euryale.AAC.8
MNSRSRNINSGFTASTLALFGAEDLRGMSIPAMNDQVKFDLAMKAMKMAGDLLSFNAVALAMKAAALAAKAIINIFLNMAKRPIAHWDPALYCAHVLLYHRCPYNPNEKQTAIVFRDVVRQQDMTSCIVVGAQLFGTRLGTDPAEDLPIAGRGECFPVQAAET